MSEKENLTDSEIAERMLKLFDGGVHWGRGKSYREAYGEYPEQWCMIGAYRQVAHGTQSVSIFELDASLFVRKLASRLVELYPQYAHQGPGWRKTCTITCVNDYCVESYEEIRQILEEMISDEQAERDGAGTAAH